MAMNDAQRRAMFAAMAAKEGGGRGTFQRGGRGRKILKGAAAVAGAGALAYGASRTAAGKATAKYIGRVGSKAGQSALRAGQKFGRGVSKVAKRVGGRTSAYLKSHSKVGATRGRSGAWLAERTAGGKVAEAAGSVRRSTGKAAAAAKARFGGKVARKAPKVKYPRGAFPNRTGRALGKVKKIRK